MKKLIIILCVVNLCMTTAAAATPNQDLYLDKIDNAFLAQMKKLKKDLTIIYKQNNIIDTAEEYIGVPYIWGGTSPRGFDCSGFTQYVFKENGYNLYRVAKMQMTQGEIIEIEDLTTGDLIFFEKTYNTQGASHVGIFIDDDQFIHCANGGVKISSLSEKYWESHLLGARRILN